MQGRVEHDMELKLKLNELLRSEPEIVRLYIDSLSELSWNTKLTYLKCVSLFIRWLEKRKSIEKIDTGILKGLLPLDISAYMSDIKYTTDKKGQIKETSSAKQMQAWSALYSFFDFLVNNRFVEINIVSKTKRPKNKDTGLVEYLNQDQISELMQKLDTVNCYKRKSDLLYRDQLIIKIFLTTGIRVEPLREINIEDIDFENKTVITINKGHKTKEFALLDEVMRTLEKWLQYRAKLTSEDVNNQSGPLFLNYEKTRLSYWSINNTVKYYTELIGIDGGYSCHKLRHTYGTVVYMTTKDIDYTKDKLGHLNVATTQRYINEIDKELDSKVDNKLNAIIHAGRG